MRQSRDIERSRWSVYLLRCVDGTLYCGATNDLARRLAAHGRGRVKYTRGRLPVVLAWHEEVGDKGPALSREAQVKRMRRADKELLIAAASGARRRKRHARC